MKPLKVGERVSVYWDMEWYKGQVTATRGDQVHVSYDDGDEEWFDQFHQQWKRVKPRPKLQIGSRLSVYWPGEKKSFEGILKIVDESKEKPHYILYDDGDDEWTNLSHRRFTLLEGEESPKGAASKEDTSSKKKTRKQCMEACVICKKVATKPWATSCCHIFCKSCLKDHYQHNCECPVCHQQLSDAKKYHPHRVDAFKSVQAVDASSGKVLVTFSSASTASLVFRGTLASEIVSACHSGAVYFKYLWRFQHQRHKPVLRRSLMKERKAVEKLDIKTGKVLETYTSIDDAIRSMGYTPGILLQEVCDGSARQSAFGFFWRWKGSDRLPKHLQSDKKKAIEIREEKSSSVVNKAESFKHAKDVTPACEYSLNDIHKFASNQEHFAGYRWKQEWERNSSPLNNPKADECLTYRPLSLTNDSNATGTNLHQDR